MENKEYSIVASAEAFETLSSKLYTNPIAAVIRELSSNAKDSQVMAGTENKQFILHIPNDDETYFEIRDFGIGMSHEFVMNVFTTYFASTKGQSEDQIGAFGLGSKSPYSLADEFYVTSFYDGKKMVYHMSKSNGCPTVEKVSEEDTNEENGLDIKIDLKSNWSWDSQKQWEDEAISFFNKFKFQPKWNLNLEEEQIKNMALSKYFYNDDNVIMRGEDSSFIFDRRYYDSNITVNVAGVVFKVRCDKISDMPDCFSCINIMADKSDVTVTPSREDLHYDDKTIAFINKRLDEIIENKYNEISEKIDSRNVNYIELKNIINNISSPEIVNKAKSLLYEAFNIITFYIDGRSVKRCLITDDIGYHYHERTPCFGLLSTKGCKQVQLNTITDTLNEEVSKSRVNSKTFCDRVKFFFEKKNDVSNREKRILVPNEGKQELAEKLLKDCDYDDFVYMNCVEKKSTESKTKRGFITQATLIYNNYEENGTGYRRSKTESSVRPDEIPLVINTDRVNNFSNYFPILRRVAPNTNIVLRVCKEESSVSNICSMNKCKDALTWATETIKANEETLKDEIKETFLANSLDEINFSLRELTEEKFDKIKTLKGKLSNFAENVLNNFIYMVDNREKIDSSGVLEKVFKEEKDIYSININKKRYPLLTWARAYTYNTEDKDFVNYVEDVLNYITLVDDMNK